MGYGWVVPNKPEEEPGSLQEVRVVTPARAADCTVTTTKVDEERYILTLDGGGRLTVQGTRAELRTFAVRVMLNFTVAADEEMLHGDTNE